MHAHFTHAYGVSIPEVSSVINAKYAVHRRRRRRRRCDTAAAVAAAPMWRPVKADFNNAMFLF